MDTQSIQDIIGAQDTPVLTSGLSQFSDILIFWSVVGLVIMVIFMIVLTASRIRSHVATVAMQKDIRAIREILEKHNRTAVPTVNTRADHIAESEQ